MEEDGEGLEGEVLAPQEARESPPSPRRSAAGEQTYHYDPSTSGHSSSDGAHQGRPLLPRRHQCSLGNGVDSLYTLCHSPHVAGYSVWRCGSSSAGAVQPVTGGGNTAVSHYILCVRCTDDSSGWDFVGTGVAFASLPTYSMS